MLLPQVVDAVDIPVIAAGGFHDGRGLVAALAYGAAGIAMGTRFLLTSDSTVPDAVKARYLAATVKDVTVTTAVDGLPHRMLRTELVDSLEQAGRTRALVQAVRRAAGFKKISGLTWSRMVRDGLAMKHGKDLSWSQVLLAANTPMLLQGVHGRGPDGPGGDGVGPGGGRDRRPAVLRGAGGPGDEGGTADVGGIGLDRRTGGYVKPVRRLRAGVRGSAPVR